MAIENDAADKQCPHIAGAMVDPNIVSKYEMVVSWKVRHYQAVANSAKRRKLAVPTCGTCNTSLSRPFACLHCDFCGCWTKGHATAHLSREGHTFCVEVKSGSVFCSICDDMVYSPAVDKLYLATTVAAEEAETRYRCSKKPRDTYVLWVPTAEDLAALEGADSIPCHSIRGLLNLGQTCFLNVVLQSFAHNPLLRNYFLGDKHNYKLCKQEECTCCEMDKFFSEMYSPSPSSASAFGPITFLSTTWKKSAELSGYAQQDAHEFFISSLNLVHTNSKGSTNISCNCIIHSTFAGQLQSDVTCERCGNTTSTIDPMLDISLELREGKDKGDSTLAGCLKRFTQPEKLGANQYSCSKCTKDTRQSNKRMSIHKLPPVMSFQFKRFEQKSSDKATARKIGTSIRFPSTLNMKPYTTFAMKDLEKENTTGAPVQGQGLSNYGPDIMYEYDLFAVINHEGQMNNGHYTNFARCGNEWYRFDDDKVTLSSLAACLSSSPSVYMCFYVKRHLDYKPHVTPTYRLARETEAEKEREEKEKQEKENKVKEREKWVAREREERKRQREVEDELLATV